jgi:hypothetical protein
MNVGFLALIAETVKGVIFWVVTPCSFEKSQCYEERITSIFYVKEQANKNPAEVGSSCLLLACITLQP